MTIIYTNEAQNIETKLCLISAIIYLGKKKRNFDENSTYGKLSKLSFQDHFFKKYQQFVWVVEHLKLDEKVNLKNEWPFWLIDINSRKL